MLPEPHEIEQISDAFITISSNSYSQEQLDFINYLLQNYAEDFEEEEAEDLFADNDDLITAFRALNEFATNYKDEESIYNEFKHEIDDIYNSLNEEDGDEGGITI